MIGGEEYSILDFICIIYYFEQLLISEQPKLYNPNWRICVPLKGHEIVCCSLFIITVTVLYIMNNQVCGGEHGSEVGTGTSCW